MDGIRVVSAQVMSGSLDELKTLGDTLRSKLGHGVGLLAAVIDNKVSLVCVVTDDLVAAKKLEAGKIVPVTDRCYPLSEVPDAIRHVGSGHARGKVVITIRSSTSAASSASLTNCAMAARLAGGSATPEQHFQTTL